MKEIHTSKLSSKDTEDRAISERDDELRPGTAEDFLILLRDCSEVFPLFSKYCSIQNSKTTKWTAVWR